MKRITHLAGRNGNGTNKVNHLVIDMVAVCGKKPGRLSAGWSEYDDDEVTCPKCLATDALAIIAAQAARIKALEAGHDGLIARVAELTLEVSRNRHIRDVQHARIAELTATNAALSAEVARLTDILAPPPKRSVVDGIAWDVLMPLTSADWEG